MDPRKSKGGIKNYSKFKLVPVYEDEEKPVTNSDTMKNPRTESTDDKPKKTTFESLLPEKKKHCNYCSAVFTRPDNLHRHISQVHGDITDED